jgi:hypothetical protein
MVVACLALSLSLSGVGYATIVLPRNSVGTPQLKANAVTSGKIKNGAVRAADIGLDQVTGDSVKEDALGQVPSAANADRLDDLDSAAFLRSTPGAVETANLADSSVTPSKLAGAEGWHHLGATAEPAFQNGWRNFGGALPGNSYPWATAGFYKDPYGVVHLKGLVEATAGTPAAGPGNIIFTLPDGYRPDGHEVFAAIASDGFARITINRTIWLPDLWRGDYTNVGGRVILEVGSTGWVSLSGISFRAG